MFLKKACQVKELVGSAWKVYFEPSDVFRHASLRCVGIVLRYFGTALMWVGRATFDVYEGTLRCVRLVACGL